MEPALGSTGQRITTDPAHLGVSTSDPVKEMQWIDYARRSDGTTVTLAGPYQIPAGNFVHVPATDAHDARWNGLAAFLLTNATTGLAYPRYMFQGQPMELAAGGNPAWGRTADTRADGTAGPANVRGWVDLYGHGQRGGHGGSGLSLIGGCLREAEWDALATDYPKHALSMNVDGVQFLSTASNGWRWPAHKADTGYNDPAHQNYYGRTNVGDGQGGTYDGMRMGVLLCLPSNFNLASITDARVANLARTMMYFGIYVADVTTSDRHAFTVQSTREIAFRDAGTTFHSEFQNLFYSMQYVDNNGPSSIGGGGTPLHALAPELVIPS